jgi:hypothetical protein
MRGLAPALAVALLLGGSGERVAGAAGREQRLRRDVARLAQDEWEGRRAGEPGARLAAAWLAEEFQGIGLEPMLPGASHRQRFSFISGAELGPGNRLSVGGRAYAASRDFRPLAFSAAGSYTGGVVFAGYGIHAPARGRDDYAGIDVRGRAVLALRYAPAWGGLESPWQAEASLRRKAERARERGAAALLIVTGPRTRGVGDVLIPFQTDAALGDVGIPVASLRRRVAEDLLYGTGLDLGEAQKLADRGLPGARRRLAVPLELATDLVPTRSSTSNVLGRLPGRVPETLVIGAHYDHLGRGGSGALDPSAAGEVHHGADDNASGTAALLELARSLAGRGARLRRSVVFAAFGAEELGLLGSVHFVERPPLPLSQVVGLLNLDMIGRLEPRGLFVQGTDTSPAWPELLEAANREPELRLRLLGGGTGPSDHASFFHMGVPVLFFFTGIHSDYHRPSDTAERIDATGMSRILSLVEPIALAVADSDRPLPFRDPAAAPVAEP